MSERKFWIFISRLYRNSYRRFRFDIICYALIVGLVYLGCHQPFATALCIVTLLAALILVRRVVVRCESAEMANGTFSNRFVFIENDGTARGLTPSEMAYLNTEFHPADGARPYFKSSYSNVAPDGNLHGFLLKRRLPKDKLLNSY